MRLQLRWAKYTVHMTDEHLPKTAPLQGALCRKMLLKRTKETLQGHFENVTETLQHCPNALMLWHLIAQPGTIKFAPILLHARNRISSIPPRNACKKRASNPPTTCHTPVISVTDSRRLTIHSPDWTKAIRSHLRTHPT